MAVFIFVTKEEATEALSQAKKDYPKEDIFVVTESKWKKVG